MRNQPYGHGDFAFGMHLDARTISEAAYALIVSIDTDAEDVDIWTPVAQQIGAPIVVETDAVG